MCFYKKKYSVIKCWPNVGLMLVNQKIKTHYIVKSRCLPNIGPMLFGQQHKPFLLAKKWCWQKVGPMQLQICSSSVLTSWDGGPQSYSSAYAKNLQFTAQVFLRTVQHIFLPIWQSEGRKFKTSVFYGLQRRPERVFGIKRYTGWQ